MIPLPTRRQPLRIVLISLPFRYFPRVETRRASYCRPPLGIAYLAAYLKKFALIPIELRCVDLLSDSHLSIEQVRDRLLKLEPDVVGMTVVTANQPLAASLATALKARRPDLWIVAGGPHITALPNECIPGVDAHVVGEGEESLLEFVQEVIVGGSTKPIAGVVHKLANDEVRVGPSRPFIADLHNLHLPARDLLPNKTYFHSFPYQGVHGFTTQFTSRGCPFSCNFCANETLWGRRVRYHSIDRVMEEVNWVVEQLGVNLIFFDDDSFTSNRRRALELMERIRKTYPKLRWICHARADAIDQEIAREMAASGCVEVQMGVESGDPDILESIGKKINLTQVRGAVAALSSKGVNVWATFILGHENDTSRTIQRTVETAIELNPTYASFIVLLPFPGTAVYERFKEKGYLRAKNWGEYSWHGYPVFETEHLSRVDLVNARKQANLAFYLRPAKLIELGWHTIRAGSWREMLRNFLSWKSLVMQ